MLPKMQQSHFVKKYSVQFVNAERQAVGAVLLLGQQAARVLADLAGRPQRVRQDDARQRPRARRRRRTKACACWTCSSRATARSACTIQRAGRHDGARSARRSSSTPAARAALLQNRFGLRIWDPVLNKGAIWTYWEGAYRDTGRDEGATHGAPDRRQEGLVLVHPAARQHRQRRRRRAVRLPVQGPRQLRADLQRRGRALPGRQGARSPTRTPRHRLLRHEGLLVPRDAGGRRRLGA